MSTPMKLPGWKTTVALVTLWILLGDAAKAADTVQWRKDYNSARKEASESGKPLFLDFGTVECFHCKRLDQSTFRDPALIQLLNERFIPLKVDANREPALTQALRIQLYPTLIIAGNDGKILGTIEGYMEAARLNEHLQRGLAVTIPDWMARDFNEASKAISANDYAKAVSLLKGVAKDGKDMPIQAKSRLLLAEIDKQAQQKIVRAKEMLDQGQSHQAMEQLTEVVRSYPGTQAADDSAKQLASLADKPAIRGAARADRAVELLARAKEDFRTERFHRCVDNCRTILETYGDAAEAKEAAGLLKDISSDPERLVKATEALAEQTAEMYGRLAEAWLLKGNNDAAAVCYDKIIRVSPNSSLAISAQTRLAVIRKNTPAIPVQFQKP